MLGRDVVKNFSFLSGEAVLKVKSVFLLRILTVLKNAKTLKFDVLADCFGVDYLKTLGIFIVFYKVRSLLVNTDIFISVDVLPEDILPSVSLLFSSATSFEREVYDMFGVRFDGQCPERILTHGSICGFPLRKDFVQKNA
jgi:NADH-quinone oxidoreductase subunit C